MQSLSQRWLKWHFSLWLTFFFALIGLSLFRLGYLYFLGPEIASLRTNDLISAFWIGFRFDLKYLAIFSGSLLLISLLFYSVSAKLWSFFRRFSLGYLFILLLLINLLGMVNYYYFSFYQSPINVLIFGLNDDDTGAILATLWSDFPVLRVLISLFIISFAQIYFAFKYASRLTWQLKAPLLMPLMLASIVIMVFFSRGSLGKFPLRAMHMSVSSNSFVNQLVPSGLHALHLANKDRKTSDLGTDPNSSLKALGFTTWQAAASQCFASSITNYADLQQKLPLNTQVEVKAPHVVVAIMEAWGRHLMLFDDQQQNDLLGNLRPWVQGKADYFPQALSVENGTHPSLEGILWDTPITPLTQGKYGFVGFDTSRALPYQKAGYKTVFLTAGPGEWRQLNKALLRQGFDLVLDKETIINAYPQATTHTWGVDDEWMFKYAADFLNNADKRGEQVLLVMLSVTNHPPYRVPDHYQPKALDESKLGSAMAVDAKFGRSILETYQYANNSLGDFLHSLEKKKLLAHTLFAATGDHQTRSIFNYPDNSQLPLKYGVPLLLHIPEAYKLSNESVNLPTKQRINPAMWAAHSDIFPTLWAHSLSEVEIPLTNGQNVYSATPETSIASSFIATESGTGIAISRAGAVTDFSQPKYYQWMDADYLKLKPLENPTPELEALMHKEKACFALKDWRIRQQVLSPQTP